MKASKIIGIGGVSQSGKSTLAKRIALQQEHDGHTCRIISQDDFARPIGTFPTIHGLPDWEHPDSIDHASLRNAFRESIELYDCVIVEGIFAFIDTYIADKLTEKIYLKIGFDTFLQRRKSDFRWGIPPDWYYQHVWDSHFIYGLSKENSVELSSETSIDLDRFNFGI